MNNKIDLILESFAYGLSLIVFYILVDDLIFRFF